MSVLGQKRTNSPGPKFGFVRSCPKADKRWCGWIVRFVPIADITPVATIGPPLNVANEWNSLCPAGSRAAISSQA